MRRLSFFTLLFLMAATDAYAQALMPFDPWLEQFKQTAAREGISSAIIEDAFRDIEPDESVVTLDQKQPENKVSLTTYLKNTVNARRIKKGRALMREHHTLLKKVSARYGVQPEYIVALWGVETDFGHYKGDFSVIQSITTLAYEGRRADFFSRELLSALKLMEREKMTSAELQGSWAGAMGDCQFMPSTYLNYAADGNGDGHRDIWNNEADIFASIANYLHGLGWNPKEGWGHRIEVPDDFTMEEADIKHAKSIAEWRARGITYAGGKPLPQSATLRYAMYPGTQEEGAYFVTENYQALLQWNRSRYFATAVGKLADKLREKNHD